MFRDATALPTPWKLTDFAPGEGVRAGAFAEGVDIAGWIDVAVPGDVHRALLAAGRIEDPFYDRNEEQCAWVEDREWWYRLEFDGPAEPPGADERLHLVFDGLDTFATIWLNGEELGRHRNMFRPAGFDVTDRVRPGAGNTLAVCFDRPLDHTADLGDEFPSWGRNTERVTMRKAQYGFGWDWGPRLPTVGIWLPVELIRERRAALRGVHFATTTIAADGNRAEVVVRVEAEQFAGDGELTARIELAWDGEPVAKAVAALTGHSGILDGEVRLTIENPHLWWTHDLGEPARYHLQVTLAAGDAVLDEDHRQVGIRTIVLDQGPDRDEPGTKFFRFVLNGVPIFAKGANWIPADSFVGAIPPERYESLLTQARHANMNMLRIWGGGIYEHDVFYELCDSLGILVWQDFMFSCAMYPDHDAAFTAEVDAEARHQVRRLRNHPSLALWCGNNENQWLHDKWNWQTPGVVVPGTLFYDEVLPGVVAELDGAVPYWPGSPLGGDDHNSMLEGDRHNWDVWHGNSPRRFGDPFTSDTSPEGVDYRRYAVDMGRFISEFGMHAAPVKETLRRVIPEDQLFHHSASMDHHNKDNPKNKGDNLMATVTGVPEDLDEYVDFSMITQAEGLKFGIEHYRRRTPHCSGTLIWQLNDCWPVLSWSIVDYYGFGKAGYFATRRVYAPVLASFDAGPDGGVELWVTNDSRDAVGGEAAVALKAFGGEVIWEQAVPLEVAAGTSVAVARWSAEEAAGGPDRYLSVRSTGDAFAANRHFFVAIKDLEREVPQVESAIVAVDAHTLEVTLTAPAFACFVHLIVPHEAARFDDNYFDLEPGERRTITVTNDEVELTPDMVTVRNR